MGQRPPEISPEKCQSSGKPEKKPRKEGIYEKSTLKRNIAQETQEKTELYPSLSSVAGDEKEKVKRVKELAGKRREQ